MMPIPSSIPHLTRDGGIILSRRLALGMLVWSPTLFACGDPAEPAPGDPTYILAAAGDSQIAVVGTTLPEPLVVRVLDEDSLPVPDVTLLWNDPELGGSTASGSKGAYLLDNEATTDGAGFARARAVLGSEPGVYHISVGFISGPGQGLGGIVVFRAAAASFEEPSVRVR